MVSRAGLTKVLAIIALLLLATLVAVPGLGETSRGSRSTKYSTDFESGSSGWTHGGAKDEWVLGKPTNGPGGCHSGTNCWATTLNDTYAPDANEWLQSPSIDLRYAHDARLEFWHYYDLFNFMGIFYDIGYLEVSADGGSSYKELMNFTGNSTSQTWEKISVNMTPHVGMNLLFRFRLVSDSMFQSDGWFIDDFKIFLNETGPGSVHDLAVVGLNPIPASPNAGQDVQLDVLVKNPGSFDEKGPQVTLSVVDLKDGTTIFTQAKQIDLITVGSTFKIPFVWRPMGGGQFKLTAKVAITDDAQPGNDTMSIELNVGTFPHDVAITQMTFAPQGPKIGTMVTISVTVRNIGSSQEKRVPVHIRITSSTDALVLEDRKPINDFAPNTLRTVDFTWTPSTPDLYIARANVDLKDDPTLENNRAEVYILVARKGVDMGVIDVMANPKDAAPMDRRAIGTRVMNIGDVNATDVVVSYTISDEVAVRFQGNSTYSTVMTGEIKQVRWDVYPDHPGVYTVKVHVKVAGDIQPDNDDGSTTFTVHSVYRDVGVESFSVVPRTDDVNITRTIVVEVANYGDINETFRTTVRVLDPTGVQVMTKDFDQTVAPGQRGTLKADFAPKTYGNYSATVTTYLSQDAQPANDAATMVFYAVKPPTHDLGLEVLTAEPRTGYPDVVRDVLADVSNNGDTAEDGLVNFTVRDSTGKVVATFSRAVHVDAGSMAEVNGTFTPGSTGNFDLVAQVSITGGNVDQSTMNDKLNVTVVSVTRPPPIDLSVESITTDPSPGIAGGPLSITVVVSNLGVEPTKGQMSLEIKDPAGKTSTLKLDFQIGSKTAITIPFNTVTPVSGQYTLKATAEATSGLTDPNMTNNVRSVNVNVVAKGTKDAALTVLTISPKGLCSMTFDVRATVQDKGAVALGTVPVVLDVSGNGKTFHYYTNVTVAAGGSAQAVFSFTAPATGIYEFSARVSAPGDTQPSNDVLTKPGEACKGGGKYKTRTNEAPIWLIILLLVVLCVVGVIFYNYIKEKKRRAAVPPPPATARPPATRSQARPPVRRGPIR